MYGLSPIHATTSILYIHIYAKRSSPDIDDPLLYSMTFPSHDVTCIGELSCAVDRFVDSCTKEYVRCDVGTYCADDRGAGESRTGSRCLCVYLTRAYAGRVGMELVFQNSQRGDWSGSGDMYVLYWKWPGWVCSTINAS